MSTLHPLAKSVPHPAPLRHAAPYGLVLSGLFAAPAAWFLELVTSYNLNGDRCHALPALGSGAVEFVTVAAAIIGILAVAVCAFGWVSAYRVWRLTRKEAPGDHHRALTSGAGRTRFLGMCGMIASTIFLAGTIVALLVPYLVSPCTAPLS